MESNGIIEGSFPRGRLVHVASEDCSIRKSRMSNRLAALRRVALSLVLIVAAGLRVFRNLCVDAGYGAEFLDLGCGGQNF
jgi:hypothetical protein